VSRERSIKDDFLFTCMKTLGSITIKKVGSGKEQVDVSYKIEDAGTEAEAKEIIKKLDTQFKKEGAQTGLDDWAE